MICFFCFATPLYNGEFWYIFSCLPGDGGEEIAPVINSRMPEYGTSCPGVIPRQGYSGTLRCRNSLTLGPKELNVNTVTRNVGSKAFNRAVPTDTTFFTSSTHTYRVL